MIFDEPFRVKLLQVADSGGGKTSSIAHVANAGYKVRVLDFDNNMRIVASYLKGESASLISRIPISPNDDDKAGHKSKSSIKLMETLQKPWVDPQTGEDLGKISSWGIETVLFIDTLTYLGRMFMRDALLRYQQKDPKTGNPTGVYPYDPDAAANFDQTVYNLAQQKLGAVVKYLAADEVKCNIVFNTHLKYSEEKGTGISRCYPDTGVGSALGPSLGKDFTDIWRIDSKHDGSKSYRTQGDVKMMLKCSGPNVIKTEETFDLGVALNKLLGKV